MAIAAYLNEYSSTCLLFCTLSHIIQQPFDVVVLDYRMPKKDGLQVAKEILKLNPKQRIIFASAYVKETLVESVKQLNQVVELTKAV